MHLLYTCFCTFALSEKEIEIIISHIVKGAKNALEGAKLFQSGANLGEVLNYQKESDTVAAFLEECAEFGENCKELRTNIYTAYINFCKEEERQPLGKTAFFKALDTKGYQKVTIKGYRYFKGIELKFMKTDYTPFNH